MSILWIIHILNGNFEHVAHTWMNIGLFGEKIRVMTTLRLIKCLRQIK